MGEGKDGNERRVTCHQKHSHQNSSATQVLGGLRKRLTHHETFPPCGGAAAARWERPAGSSLGTGCSSSDPDGRGKLELS